MTPEDYFAAAFEILEEEGFLGLKQATLCARLQVTTGSFYTHFASWQDFRERLLRDWYERRTQGLVDLAESALEPWDKVQRLREQTMLLPRRTEAAIRAWGASDPEVAEFQQRVDDQRTELAARAMTELVGDPDEGRRYAMAGMFLITGWESLDRSTPEMLDWTLGRLLSEVAAQLDAKGPTSASQ